MEGQCPEPLIRRIWAFPILAVHMEKLQVSLHAQRRLHTNQGWFALCVQALFHTLRGVGILEKTGWA